MINTLFHTFWKEEDGQDMVGDRAVFDCGDDRTPEQLARDMLGKAPESIRKLFASA